MNVVIKYKAPFLRLGNKNVYFNLTFRAKILAGLSQNFSLLCCENTVVTDFCELLSPSVFSVPSKEQTWAFFDFLPSCTL